MSLLGNSNLLTSYWVGEGAKNSTQMTYDAVYTDDESVIYIYSEIGCNVKGERDSRWIAFSQVGVSIPGKGYFIFKRCNFSEKW